MKLVHFATSLLFTALSLSAAVAQENIILDIPPLGGDERFEFSLPAPDLGTASKYRMWATSYWLPRVHDKETGHALRTMSGDPLAYVTNREWCDAAMEGSIQIEDNGGTLTTYNYAGTTTDHQVDCSPYFNHKPTHKVKFRVAMGEYGDGIDEYKLVPFRSIAVDPTYYPFGSVVYIPAARGNVIKLPDGSHVVHDGYYYAVDKGGLIKTNHIDVFRGIAKEITQPWIKSNPNATFDAYIVNDPAIKEMMERIHQ